MGEPKPLPVGDAPNWAEMRFGLAADELELRVLRDRLGCEHIGVSYLRFGPDWPLTTGHRHPAGGEEVYVLIEGSARIKIGEDVVHMEAPAAIRVPSEEFRAIRAAGDAPAVFVVAGYPIEDPDETVLAPDFWPLNDG